MPNIKPVSELHNYGEYKEFEKMLAWRKLKEDLDKGWHSGEEKGWVSPEEVEAELGICYEQSQILVGGKK